MKESTKTKLIPTTAFVVLFTAMLLLFTCSCYSGLKTYSPARKRVIKSTGEWVYFWDDKNQTRIDSVKNYHNAVLDSNDFITFEYACFGNY